MEKVPIKRIKNPSHRRSRLTEIRRIANDLKTENDLDDYPIIVNRRTNIVIDGLIRLEAARMKGWKTIPVEYCD